MERHFKDDGGGGSIAVMLFIVAIICAIFAFHRLTEWDEKRRRSKRPATLTTSEKLRKQAEHLRSEGNHGAAAVMDRVADEQELASR